MKYIKVILGVLIAVWVATMVMGSRIKPGSFFYPMRTAINDPLWVWVHITAPGRATALEGVLNTRYAELEHAWFARDEKQIIAAKKSLLDTNDVVMSAVQGYATAGDYKVADSLASFAISMARIHGQVLETLVTHGAVAQTMADVGFAKDAALAMQAVRVEVIKKFSMASSKEDLVRGIDAQLNKTRDLQDAAQSEFNDATSVLQPAQKDTVANILVETKAGYEEAKSKLGIDQYVESFVQANTVQARISEVRVAIRATKEFGVPVIPSEVIK